MRKKSVLVITVLFCLSGCNVNQAPRKASEIKLIDSSHVAVAGNEAQHRVIKAPQDYLGNSRATIIEKLGVPLKSSESTERNLHEEGVTNYIHTLYYQGLTVDTYEARKYGKEFLLSLDLTRDFPEISGGLKMGLSQSEVIKALGKPASELPSSLEYRATDEDFGDWAVLTIHFVNGKLSRFEWSFFLD